MSDITVRMIASSDKELLKSEAVAQQLRDVAGKVRKKVVVRKGLVLSTRAGVGPRGAFSQVILTGPGAITEEFGTKTRPAKAPLRTALRGAR